MTPLISSNEKFGKPPPPHAEAKSSLLTNLRSISVAILQSPLTSSPHHIVPRTRCKKNPIIVYLRCFQNYGVSGGGRRGIE